MVNVMCQSQELMIDRVFKVAVALATCSVLASTFRTNVIPFRHALLLCVFLVIARFPESIEFGIRNSYRGLSHNAEPTPPIAIQLTAVATIVVVTVAHHSSI